MNGKLFQSIEGTVGYGNIGLDGSLGCHDIDLFLPPSACDWEGVGAHAPSTLKIATKYPVEIKGTLDGSTGRLFIDDPVEYFIDDGMVGSCIGPWDETRSIVISPGSHVLAIRNRGTYQQCHSAWLGRRIDREQATPENTVFLSVDTFGGNAPYSSLFRNSAERHGINVVFLDEGLDWRGFYHHKIEKMMPVLREWLGRGKRFAFILDARDVVFIDPLSFMLAKFNAIQNGKLIYNTDGLGATYPCGQEWFKDAYRRATGHFQAALNAGVLAGPIDVFLEVMSHCRSIRNEIIQGTTRPGIMDRLYREHGTWACDDDQYLYQLCQMYHPEYFMPDIGRHLCVHLKDFPVKEWRHFFDYRDGRSTGSASILHFPDRGSGPLWKEWVEWDGNPPDLKMNSVTIGFRRCGHGFIAIDGEMGLGGLRVKLSGLQDSDETIGAHADSYLEIDVHEKTNIAGGLNETAVDKNRTISVEFYIDEKKVAMLNRADSMTPFIRLYPGRHRLSIRAIGTNRWAHSLWIVRKECPRSLQKEPGTTCR